MKDCNYPKCTQCVYPECNMNNKDIAALIKRRRYHNNPEIHRLKQSEYRAKVRANLPHCDECEMCVVVQKANKDGYTRLCFENMRLIEQKVSNSPIWCRKR